MVLKNFTKFTSNGNAANRVSRHFTANLSLTQKPHSVSLEHFDRLGQICIRIRHGIGISRHFDPPAGAFILFTASRKPPGVIKTIAWTSSDATMKVWGPSRGSNMRVLSALESLLGGCIILLREQPELQGRQLLWLVLCAPTLDTLDWGQVYTGAFLLGVLAWTFNKHGHYVPVGIAIGTTIALRPTMAFWLLILFLSGHRKALAPSIGTIVVLYILPLFFYGNAIYLEWLHAFENDWHWLDPLNIAAMPLASRHSHAAWGVAIAILIVLFVCWWAMKTRPDFTSASGSGICLGIVCAPLAWFLYILFAAPFLMARKWTTVATVGAGLFLIRHQMTHTNRGIVYLVGTLIFLIFFIATPTVNRDHPMKAYDPPPPPVPKP